jgi:hypothetical protein
LISFVLGEPWNGAESESLKHISRLHPVIPSWELRELPTNLGIQLDNIERMFQLSAAADEVALVTTRQPYDRDKVLSAFVPAAVEKSAGGKRYFYSDKSKNSVIFLNERTLVLGVGRDLQSFLNRPTLPKPDPSLDSALRAIENGAPFVVYHGPTMVRSMATAQRLTDGPYAALARAQAWQIIAEIDKGLSIKLLADFANEKDAADSTAALTLIGEKLTGFMPMMKANMVPFLKAQDGQYPGASELAPKMASAIDAATEALKAANVQSKNNRAEAQIVIKTDEPMTTAVLLLTLTPRAQKE